MGTTLSIIIAGLILIEGAYVFLMYLLRIGWKSLGGCREIRDAVKVSVVIAARYEEKNIQACLDALANQHYPRDRFEVILVDDHSGDRTVQVAEACIRRHPELNFRVHSSSASPGKKAALREGLKLASGEIVLTTDADCVPNPGWIRAMTAALLEKDAVFVSGPVVFENQSGFFGKLQELEFLSLIVSGAGAIGAGFPLMCNGANLGFSMEAFRQLEENAMQMHLASGDDVFLMLAMQKKYGSDKITFARCPDAIVKTLPETTFKGFIRQRLRWTSKSTAYRNIPLILSALAVFLMNLILVGTLLTAIFIPESIWLFLALLFVKIIADLPLLTAINRFTGKYYLNRLILPAELPVAIYTFVVALAGLVAPVKWK